MRGMRRASGNDARVGRVNPVDVGVDQALIGFQCGSERDSRRVGAASTQRGDVAAFVDPLKSGDHDDRSAIEILANLFLVDIQDPRLIESAIGQHVHLCTGIAFCFQPTVEQCHRKQPDGDLLAGRSDDIEFARIRDLLHLLRQIDQAVGLSAHRRDDDDQLMAGAMPLFEAMRHIADALDRADRSAAVLVNDERHADCCYVGRGCRGARL